MRRNERKFKIKKIKDTVTGKFYSFRFSICLLFILFNSSFSFLLPFIYSILFPLLNSSSFLLLPLYSFFPLLARSLLTSFIHNLISMKFPMAPALHQPFEMWTRCNYNWSLQRPVCSSDPINGTAEVEIEIAVESYLLPPLSDLIKLSAARL